MSGKYQVATPAEEVKVEEKDKQGRLIRTWSRGKLLGKGGFAKCYELKDPETEERFAVKVIEKKSLEKPKTLRKLQSEIRIHRSIRHPNVVHFHRHFEDSSNVYILLELCKGQTLMEHSKQRGRFTELETSYLLSQLIDAVRHMHAGRVIHRDLKLNNIMLTQGWDIKVGDFGLATQLVFDGERKRTVCGTPNYIAPEVLSGSSRGHSYEVDMWSLGVIVYALLVGRPPFETNDLKTTYQRIKQVQYCFPPEAQVAPEARDLVSSLLQADPSRRHTLEQLSCSLFFKRFPPPAEPPASLFVPPPPRTARSSRDRDAHRAPLGRLDHNRPAGQRGGVVSSPRGRLAPDPNAACAAPRTGRRQSRPPATSRAHPGALLPRRNASAGAGSRKTPSEDRDPMLLAPSPRGLTRRSPSPAPPTGFMQAEEEPRVNPQSAAGSGVLLLPRASASPRCRGGASCSPPPPVGSSPRFHEPSPAPRSIAAASVGRAALYRVAPSAEGATTAAGSSQRPGMTPEERSPSLPYRGSSQSPEQAAMFTVRRTRGACDSASPAPAPQLSPQCRPLTSNTNQGGIQPPARIPAEDGTEPVAAAPEEGEVWVVEYADFTAKYGMAFRTSDDRVGVHFNDGTKMAWDYPSGLVDYVSRKKEPVVDGAPPASSDQSQRFLIDAHPEALKKKVTLIKYFRSYLYKARGREPKEGSPPVVVCSKEKVTPAPPLDDSCGEDLVYVKRWLRTERAVAFRLSTRTVQVCFHDGGEIHLSSDSRCVSHTDARGVRSLFNLDEVATRGGAGEEVAERLRYTKDIINKLIHQGHPRAGGVPTAA
eukprot:Hpha_TRINITY_DN15587_c1_g6::TRINITY_DN15587_c1_g6_i1::g.108459::m.108459/K06631/PLK1; polo-like kinase 1